MKKERPKLSEESKKKKLAYDNLWRKRHPDVIKKRQHDNHIKNAEKYRKIVLERYRGKRKRILEHYSGNPPKCMCCGESNLQFLTIDHINNDGNKLARPNRTSLVVNQIIRDNFPDDIQILCFNCNCGKNVNKGICPHKNIIQITNE